MHPERKNELLDNASELLSHYKAVDYYGRLQIYDLSIKLYCESERDEQLLYICDAFEHFIKDHSSVIPAHLVESYSNFQHLISKMIKVQYSSSVVTLNELINEVENTKLCVNRNWLKSKTKTLLTENIID